MTRTRFEDDDRDGPRPPPRSTGGPLVLGLVVVGILVVFLCGGGALWLLGVQRQRDVRAADERIAAMVRTEQQRLAAEKDAAARAERGPAPRVVADRPRLGRKEFEAAVRGKTRDQVVAAVGPPDATREKVPAEEQPTDQGGPPIKWLADWLVYRDRVVDDATGRPFAEVSVRLGPTGRADRFEYR